MTNLQSEHLASTASAAMISILLASSIVAANSGNISQEARNSSPRYQAEENSASIGIIKVSLSATTPTEEDFRKIALSLAMSQEPLGDAFDSVLVNHIEDFLD